MKTLLTTILILFSLSTQAKEVTCKIKSVTDGDTVKIEEIFHGLPLSIRVLGIDTAEKGNKAKCVKEAKLGEKATAFTTKAIQDGKVITCDFIKWDKFGGRILANINIDGKDLATMLIDNGLAREYHGEKKGSWCK